MIFSPFFYLFLFAAAFYFQTGYSVNTYREAWSYVTVRADARIFWWLNYADVPGNGYENLPLVIWLQGGPGASSTGYGNFMEIGPLDVNLRPRNTTWISKASVLFIDNPVGVGFSYVTNDSALVTNNEQIATDLVVFMKNFLDKMPEFQKNPIFVFSESYGGKMTVSFALAMTRAIKSGKINCNFKGIALGDSWISPINSVASWGPYLYTMSLIDTLGVDALSNMTEQIRQALQKQEFAKATVLWSATEDLVEKLTNGVNFYNILDKTDVGKNRTPKTSLFSNPNLLSSYYRHVGYFQSDPLSTLMNGKIREKLQVIPQNVTWGGQSDKVFEALSKDFMRPVTKIVDLLLNTTDLKVAVYSGQLDLIVDTIGTLKWVHGLKWPGMEDFIKSPRVPIMVNGKTGAFKKTFKNLSFYWILNAGHMVPADAGKTALSVLDMILQSAS